MDVTHCYNRTSRSRPLAEGAPRHVSGASHVAPALVERPELGAVFIPLQVVGLIASPAHVRERGAPRPAERPLLRLIGRADPDVVLDAPGQRLVLGERVDFDQ